MRRKTPLKIIVCAVISLSMMCTPVFGSYSVLSAAHGIEGQTVLAEQTESGGQDDPADKETQPATDETQPADQEGNGEATGGNDDPDGENANQTEDNKENLPEDDEKDADEKEDHVPVVCDLNDLVTNAKI